MIGVRNPAVVAGEIGGMSFVVHDISEWRGMYESTVNISYVFGCLLAHANMT